jgi:hypothetical protein
MMTVGDEGHCADAVTGNAKTEAANNAGRTLVFMTSNLQSAPPQFHLGAPADASSPSNQSLILVNVNEAALRCRVLAPATSERRDSFDMASPFLMLVRHRPGRNAAQFFGIVVVGHDALGLSALWQVARVGVMADPGCAFGARSGFLARVETRVALSGTL